MRLMLISSSVAHGHGYLEHCAASLLDFLGSIRKVTFLPYALKDWDAYTRKARDGFAKFGVEVESVGADGRPDLQTAEAIFVGGGNTFRLLCQMQEYELIEPIRQRVAGGMLYMGASAGSNLACPTIKTTNDMPIVFPRSFDALGLVHFQINPHYIDADPASTHMGETREKRLAEFHEENDTRVIGLREGSWLRVDGDRATLGGTTGAKLFVKGAAPEEWREGTREFPPPASRR
ncbi:MAG: dipeptidase PepE [Candidatus Solibacter sp.]